MQHACVRQRGDRWSVDVAVDDDHDHAHALAQVVTIGSSSIAGRAPVTMAIADVDDSTRVQLGGRHDERRVPRGRCARPRVRCSSNAVATCGSEAPDQPLRRGAAGDRQLQCQQLTTRAAT